MTSRLTFGRAAVAAGATLAASFVVPASPAGAAPQPAAGVIVAAKSDRGALRVIAQGLPQGRSAKITVSGPRYRKKLPSAGKLRNLKPGRYKVWAAPVVADGGTAAVPNSPVTVRVPRSRSATVRLTYQWSPKTDFYAPGPITALQVTQTAATTVALTWVNSVAPDLQGVAVRRKQGTEPPVALDDGKAVPVNGLATSALDSGLRQYTAYSYSVFMLDTAGNASAPKSITTRTTGHAVKVVAGTEHTCALLAETASAVATGGGQVACWGANNHGQLGVPGGQRTYEPQLVDLAGVTQISAGGDHTCAVLLDATVWCWGRNDHGQLGNGTTTDSSLPVLAGLNAATKTVVAGGDHTCAVSMNDGPRCWGDNQFGQTGQKPSEKVVLPPSMPLTNSVSAIVAGWSHTCYVRGGVVRCFGANATGQLGNGTTDDSWAAVAVPGLTKATGLSAGVGHTCATLTDRSLYCWGANEQGQLGDGTTNEQHLPVPVTGGVSEVAAGLYHTCAVADSGARCWGRGAAGRLGDGTTTDRLVPTRVSLSTPVTTIAAGGYHSCAVTATDTYCWGANAFGQVGTDAAVPVLRPVTVSTL
jgi:alpha-tubulin suppressor-like RCC1 family protein